jgi:lysophospholipase L1-like esterase
MGEAAARLVGHTPLQLQPDWLEKLRTIQRPVPGGGPLLYELVPGGSVEFIYRGPPVTYRVNEDGLRSDRSYARPKPPGVRRVLLLGDSVLFGLGVPVDDTLAPRLEKLLPGVEAINSGVGGYNTFSQRIWLETRGPAWQPDAVVVVYCPNDVDEPLEQFSIQTAQALPEFPPESIPNPAYHAGQVDQFQRRAAATTRRRGLREFVQAAQRRSALVNLCLQPFAFGRRSRSHERCLRAMMDLHSPEYAWLDRQLRAIVGLARARKAPVYFVYVPVRYELDPGDAMRRELGRHVRELAARCGMEVVDVGEALAAIGESHLDVTHLTAEGHRVVAEALARALAPRAARRAPPAG